MSTKMIVENIVEKHWLSKTSSKIYKTVYNKPTIIYGSDNKNLELRGARIDIMGRFAVQMYCNKTKDFFWYILG